MEASRKEHLRSAAQHLLQEFWRESGEGCMDIAHCDTFLRSLPAPLVTKHFGFALEQPRQLPASWAVPGFETAGVLDLQGRRVVICGGHRREWRRFTIAHEIGHIVLHADRPEMVFHRDRPLTGGELRCERRPLIEREADYFASHLLMPPKHVRKLFLQFFGDPIDAGANLDKLASLLSPGTGRRVSAGDLAERGPDYVAFLVAQTQSFGDHVFAPLATRLCVSPSAMGYQLQELGLVR